MSRRTPDAEIIAARYRSGESVVAIAKHYSVHTSTITRIAARFGVPRRTKVRRHLTAAEQREVLQRYERGELSAHIAEAFDTDVNMIARTVRRLGGKVRPLGRQWKGKSFIDANGYRMLSVRAGDPIVDAMRYENGRVAEHRLVMARSLGRALGDDETVHHINGVRSDNRTENLQLRQGQHGTGSCFRCGDCGSHNVIAVAIASKD